MAYKILTIDDSKMVRMIVTKTFTALGCEISEAGGGVDGLALAKEKLPDLIFLDITMGDMNGLDVLEQLRQTPTLAATPVIMLTAESGNNSIARADELKVSGYMAKPFKAEELVKQASAILPALAA